MRRATSTLVRELPAGQIECGGYQTSRVVQLRFVGGVAGHFGRNAVGSEDNPGCWSSFIRNPGQSAAGRFNHRLDESGVVVENPNLVERHRISPERFDRAEHILPVLPATGLGAECGGDENQHPRDAIRAHLVDRVGEQRMPVAIAEVDRQVDSIAATGRPRAQRSRRGSGR